MDETERYLNNILERRMGSVIPVGGSKKATVTRLPQKEEKMQAMPTVFRKKTETIIKSGQNLPTAYLPEYRSLQQRSSIERRSSIDKKQPKESQRVEYMAISKRISQKKEEVFTQPAVDVTQNQRVKPPLPVEVPLEQKEPMKIIKQVSSMHEIISEKSELPRSSKEMPQPRRKKIFD